MAKRVILIVMDSFGIGAEPDADLFGDVGTNTLKSCTKSTEFRALNLAKLGLFGIDGVEVARPIEETSVVPTGTYGRLRERSMGKDTTIGHWEIAGVVSEQPLPTFPDGFPDELLDEFTKVTGYGVLCNKTYSGTKVINDYGDEHIATKKLIVYTSADSVFQIAAHESIVAPEELYEICRKARQILKGKYGVGRVIARPFEGESGNYVRTPRRHDFSLVPPKETMLDILKVNGKDTLAVGKINDIFAGAGIGEYVYTTDNQDGIDKTIEYMKRDFDGVLFVNLVDYDMKYGHRRDIDGYARAIAEFDDRLPEIVELLRDDDILMITADHGCDPGYLATTDHTREYIPFVATGKHLKKGNLGTRQTFADIAASILAYFELDGDIAGNNMLEFE